MKKKYLPNSEIIVALKELHCVTSDNALSDILGVSRQSLWQFKNGKVADIKIKIICNLLSMKTEVK